MEIFLLTLNTILVFGILCTLAVIHEDIEKLNKND